MPALGGPYDSSTTAIICPSTVGRPQVKVLIKSGTQGIVNLYTTQRPGDGWHAATALYESETVALQFVALEWDVEGGTVINIFWLDHASRGHMRAYDTVRGRSHPIPLVGGQTSG